MKNLSRFGVELLMGILMCAVLVYGRAVFGAQEVSVDPFYQRDTQVKDLLNQIGDKKDKIDSIKKATDEYQKKIEQAQKQSTTLQNQIGILDNLITKVQLDVKMNQLKIDKNKLEIDAIEYELGKREEEIGTLRDQIGEYLKLIEKQDRQSTLELLLLHHSLSDFFTQVNYAQELQADLKKSIDRIQLAKDQLATRKSDLLVKQEELTEARKALEQSQLSLLEDSTAKESLLAQSKNSESTYNRLLVQNKQIQNEVDTDISTIEEQIKKKIEKLRVSGTTSKTTLVGWPVDHTRGISAYFHDPGYPFRHVFEHPAIDIRAYQGTPINAPADGYVSKVRDNGYGYSYIILIHDNGISTVYGHVSRILVREDQFVKAGYVIGLSGGKPGTRGAGPFTTGPHLHFEVRLNGIPVDPLDYLP